jgi:heme/copper-type cytochrome/quinol oxidase subunit 3
VSANSTGTILDVSGLPRAFMDHRSPIWWGNVLMLLIESTMFVLLIASYYYFWQNFERWPPPRPTAPLPTHDTLPRLGWASVILVVQLFSIAPMLLASRACLTRSTRVVEAGLGFTVALGLACVYLEWRNLDSLIFRWDENAYASVTWMLLGLHLLHTIVATGENTVMLVYLLTRGLDEKHARDVRVAAPYWYWVAGMWAVVYAVVYLSPRVV